MSPQEIDQSWLVITDWFLYAPVVQPVHWIVCLFLLLFFMAVNKFQTRTNSKEEGFNPAQAFKRQ